MGEESRRRVPAAGPWAPVVGYSRAVRVGDTVHVAGTTAVSPSGGIAHPGDPYLQARRCFEIILDALRQLGAGPEHVVRTRMYITDPAFWEAVGRAHGEVFAVAMPASSMVVVKGLIDPDMLVEIEAEAIVS